MKSTTKQDENDSPMNLKVRVSVDKSESYRTKMVSAVEEYINGLNMASYRSENCKTTQLKLQQANLNDLLTAQKGMVEYN